MSRCFFIATPGGEGGVASHFMALGNALAEQGHRVVILIDGQRKEKERHEGNPLIYTWPSKRPIKFRDAYFLFKLIGKFHPDCLITNFGAVNVMMGVGWLCRVRVRICWYHTLTNQIILDSIIPRWHLNFLNYRKQWVYRMATHIVAVSQAAKADICKEFTLPPSKVKVLYNLLADPLELININITFTNKKHSIICVGRFNPSKGQDILIKAMAILKNKLPYLHAEFVGEGPFKDYCVNLACELNLREKCVFVGKLSHDEVIKRMAESYVTVVPSHNEAFGYVNIESMAVGTPVIASNTGGIPEIVRDGIDGNFFPPANYKVLAEKLYLIISDPYLRDRMGKKARKRYLDNFELKNNISELTLWLNDILKN